MNTKGRTSRMSGSDRRGIAHSTSSGHLAGRPGSRCSYGDSYLPRGPRAAYGSPGGHPSLCWCSQVPGLPHRLSRTGLPVQVGKQARHRDIGHHPWKFPRNTMTDLLSCICLNACQADAGCHFPPRFQARLDAIRDGQRPRIRMRTNACARHFGTVVVAITTWADEQHLTDGDLTIPQSNRPLAGVTRRRGHVVADRKPVASAFSTSAWVSRRAYRPTCIPLPPAPLMAMPNFAQIRGKGPGRYRTRPFLQSPARSTRPTLYDPFCPCHRTKSTGPRCTDEPPVHRTLRFSSYSRLHKCTRDENDHERFERLRTPANGGPKRIGS